MRAATVPQASRYRGSQRESQKQQYYSDVLNIARLLVFPERINSEWQ
jgi:hypothetical protein